MLFNIIMVHWVETVYATVKHSKLIKQKVFLLKYMSLKQGPIYLQRKKQMQ